MRTRLATAEEEEHVVSAKRIGVGYLGGHPAESKPTEYGMLDVTDDGGVRFSAMKYVNMMERPVDLFAIAGDAIRDVTVTSGAKVRRGGKAFAFAMGGAAGLAAHQKRVGALTTPLDVSFTAGGKEYVAHFAVQAGEAAQWLAEFAAVRRASGLAAVGTPPQPSSPSVADEIGKLVRLRDAGALTPEEFEGEKARLLGGAARA